MSTTLTPRQALLLWCVLGRQGVALQGTIVPKVAKGDREALVAAGYLEVGKRGRSLLLAVTDKGWDWAGRHLSDPLPPSFRALQDWLALIDRHLAEINKTLADLVGLPPEAKALPIPKKQPSSGRGRRSRKTWPLGADKLRDRIEQAYLALTNGRKAQAVRLSAIRRELSDLDRATVDTGLATILRGDPTARLSQFSDPRSLDAVEREAAYSPAGEPFHILWIQS